MSKKLTKTPEEQAINPGKGGIVPPVEHQWKPGQSGNPAGRKTAGATITEHINSMGEQGLPESELRRIANDPVADWTRRAAAIRIIRTLEAPDLADYEPVLDGSMALPELRTTGVNTAAVKKLKTRTRTDKDGGTEIEREIELYDRSGDDFDRVMDQTKGRPQQSIDVTTGGEPITVKVLRGVSLDDL